MEAPEHRTRNRLPFLLAAAILAAAILYSIFGDVGIVNTYKIHEMQKQLEKENRGLRQEVAELRTQVEALRSNPSAIEEIARKELGLIGKKENVIVLERNKDADIPPPKSRPNHP